ncbi:MAG: hypothetical protein U0Z44_06725 [Kouleothrix sp.]
MKPYLDAGLLYISAYLLAGFAVEITTAPGAALICTRWRTPGGAGDLHQPDHLQQYRADHRRGQAPALDGGAGRARERQLHRAVHTGLMAPT